MGDYFQKQTRQAAGAMKEQAKALKHINDGSVNITKQMKLITKANVENSRSATTISGRVKGLQDISWTNAEEAKNIRGVLGKSRATQGSH